MKESKEIGNWHLAKQLITEMVLLQGNLNTMIHS